MSQRTSLVTAAALTAFVLVVVGGLLARLSQPAAPATATVAAAPTVAQITLDPTAQALLAEREAAYRQALAEANHRIEQANAQLAAANAQLAQAGQSAPAPAAEAPGYAVSRERAQQIALATTPGAALSQAAELVLYEGQPAYEIILDRGLIYVDAQSGAVLASSATTPAAPGAIDPAQAAQIAITYRGGGEVREVEREEAEGRLIYEVKFTDRSAVYVDAASGRVVYARIAGDGTYTDEHDGHEGDERDHDD